MLQRLIEVVDRRRFLRSAAAATAALVAGVFGVARLQAACPCGLEYDGCCLCMLPDCSCTFSRCESQSSCWWCWDSHFIGDCCECVSDFSVCNGSCGMCDFAICSWSPNCFG
jgi:hypothetical protein